MKGRDWCARPSGKGLVVTSIVPGWNFGWRDVLEDEIAEDMLSGLGHYARQYIHRSNIAKVLMAAWERNGLVLHPFGEGLNFQRYSDFQPRITHVEMFAAAERSNAARWGCFPKALRVYRTRWSDRNTLDPAIHQAIFHFLRAQRLVAADFELEALAAYDCVLHSLQISTGPGRPAIPSEIGAIFVARSDLDDARLTSLSMSIFSATSLSRMQAVGVGGTLWIIWKMM